MISRDKILGTADSSPVLRVLASSACNHVFVDMAHQPWKIVMRQGF